MRGEKAAFVRLQENLDQLFSNLSDGLLLFDQQDRLVLATPAAQRFLGAGIRITGASPGAWKSSPRTRPCTNCCARPSRPASRCFGKPSNCPASRATRVAVNAQFVGVGDQRVGCLITLRDTGSRAEIQDQIDTTTKLAAIGRLMSGVAHEVKNPLNAMVLQLEVLKARLGEEGDKVQPQVDSPGGGDSPPRSRGENLFGFHPARWRFIPSTRKSRPWCARFSPWPSRRRARTTSN